jgi:hypothetical protein
VPAVITRVLASVIQNTMARVGAWIVVRRICCVPSAQTAAASSMPSAASGLPLMAPNSCQRSKATPPAAAATPATWRGVRRSPNMATPQSAEKIGMV